MDDSVGEEVKEAVVIGYEPNDPLERGDERMAERVGAMAGEGLEGGGRRAGSSIAMLSLLPTNRWLFITFAYNKYV